MAADISTAPSNLGGIWMGRASLGASFRFPEAERKGKNEQAGNCAISNDGYSIFLKDLEDSGLSAGSGDQLDRFDGVEL